MVEDFKSFDEVMKTWSEKLELFVHGVHELTSGVQSLSEGLAEELKRQDRMFISEGCRLREAAQQIARRDAPHSVIAKFNRNVEFNMATPLKDHLENHEQLRQQLEKRELCLTALKDALQQVELCEGLTEADLRKRLAQDEFRASKVWWLVLVPILLAVCGPEKYRAFVRMNFSIFLLNEHLFNLPMAFLSHWLLPRKLVFLDFWVATVFATGYLFFYLFVLDANGAHFYIILSPRPWWCIFSYTGILLIYAGLFWAFS